jgi:hypothetical protein
MGEVKNGTQATARQRNRDECATFDGGINMCSYDSHDDMLGRLEALAKRNPKLASVGSIGKSVEGRELAYIKISQNVGRRCRFYLKSLWPKF